MYATSGLNPRQFVVQVFDTANEEEAIADRLQRDTPSDSRARGSGGSEPEVALALCSLCCSSRSWLEYSLPSPTSPLTASEMTFLGGILTAFRTAVCPGEAVPVGDGY